MQAPLPAPSNRRHFLRTCAGFTLLLAPLPGFAAPGATPLRIGLVTDAHSADREPQGTRHYRQSPDRLRAAIRAFNESKVDLVMQLGDLVDKGPDPLPAALALFKACTAPVVHLAGNHDFDNGAAGVTAQLGFDIAGPERGARSESRSGWRFLHLNGAAVSTYAWLAESEPYREAGETLAQLKKVKAPNAQPWNGGLGAGQRAWLKAQLKASAEAGERVIVFCHFPVLDATGAHNLWDAGETLALLADAPHVAAWINGHNHAGGYARRGSTHHLNLRAVVETPDTSAFAIATLFADRIEIAGTGREPSRKMDRG